MSIKINKINWAQFGQRSISVKTNRVPPTGAYVEIMQSDKYGNRMYPHKYLITPENAHKVERFHWGEAYVYLCNDLEDNASKIYNKQGEAAWMQLTQ